MNIYTNKKSYHALIHEKKEFEKIVLIDWSLGSTCNYKCSYCPDHLHDSKIPWISKDYLLKGAGEIITHYERLGRICCFQFTGGEPTLHPDFSEIVRTLKTKNCYLSLISNGSMPISWRKDNVRFIDQVNITYHGEFAQFETFYKLIDFLGLNTRVNINVTMDPKQFEERKKIVLELLKKSKGYDISVTAKPLLVDFGEKLYDYTVGQLNFLDSKQKITQKLYKNQVRGEMIQVNKFERKLVKPAQLLAINDNNWYGWSCYIGLESLVIDMKGEIYRGHCKVGGKIGNIHNLERLNLPNKGIRCNKKICNCLADILTTKVNK